MDLGGACVRIRQKDHDFNNLLIRDLNITRLQEARGTLYIQGCLYRNPIRYLHVPQGCLWGYTYSWEMNAMERMSWISVQEEDMYDGTMEQDILTAVLILLKND